MMVRAKDSDGKAGLTPAQWHDRLEQAAEDPAALAAELAELEREMKSERSWLHHNPSPDGLLRGLIDFFLDDKDDDYERLARKVRSELHREAQLTERFRSWTQGEDPRERLFPYLKDFGEKVYRQHQPHSGIVLLRLDDERPAAAINALKRLFRACADQLSDSFAVVTETRVRLRRT